MSVKQWQGEDLGLFLPPIHFYLETPKCHERACRKTSLTPPALWFSPWSTSFTPSLCSRNMPGILGRKIIFLSQAGLKNDAYKCLRTRYPNDMWQKDSNLAVLERNALFRIQQKEGQLEGWAPIQLSHLSKFPCPTKPQAMVVRNSCSVPSAAEQFGCRDKLHLQIKPKTHGMKAVRPHRISSNILP